MNVPEWTPVANALIGSWPSQVTSWGKAAIAAYFAELEARGVTPNQALVAIRSCPADQKFPPSAPGLAGLARLDASTPTFAEALTLIRTALRAGNQPLAGSYGTEAQMIKAREEMVQARAEGLHPLVASFIARYGIARLQDDVAELAGEYGGLRRKDLERDWDRHCEVMDGRDLAAIAAGRRGELGRLDPLAAIGRRPVAGALDSGDEGGL